MGDLLVPELDTSTQDMDGLSVEVSYKDVSRHFDEKKAKSKILKNSNSCSLKNYQGLDVVQDNTLCMSSFSRRKVVARNLGTPVNSLNPVLLPIFSTSE